MTTGQHTFTGVQLRFETLEDDCLSLFSGVDKAVEALASQDGVEGRGAIFTRAEIVEFILDLAGYVPERPLHQMRILEPSFGGGNFLFPIIDRLLVSWKDSRISGSIVNDLGGAIRAVELHRRTYAATRQAIIKRLQKEGLDAKSVLGLVDCWLRQGDFLLQPVDGDFDFVVGNPPYVRQEQIPAALLAEYRKRYKTIYDRADLYIPFIERSLMMLNKTGLLAFICADRWMKNRYGGPLRKLVAEAYHLKAYVDMTGVPAFSGNVSAYPAIVLIGREGGGFTRVAHKPEMEQRALKLLAGELRTPYLPNSNKLVRELSCVTNGTEPWLFESSDHVNLIRRLEHSHPTIEGAACKIGIGVATGADGVFIGDADKLDVEPDRKLPLVATRDIVSGEVRWRGKCVVNPFDENGCLVNLSCFPRLRDYFEVRQELIKSRHCAQKNPACWYRTIDRILPSLTTTKKLLIPDIKGRANIVFEKGQFYPHHNLYYIVSEEWNLHALQAVLLSRVTMLFMGTYSTKIRGGCLRFQAQYIRRIRIPYWRNVPDNLREELIEAAMCRDIVKCNTASFKLYGLSRVEMKTLENIGD